MRRTVAQIVWEMLSRESVDVIFGIPGRAIMDTGHQLRDYDIRHVLVSHEQRTGLGKGRSGHRDVGAGSHEPDHWHRHGGVGFLAYRLYNRAAADPPHRIRRLRRSEHHVGGAERRVLGGHGAHTDIMVVTAKAYISALDRPIVTRREGER